MNDCNTNLFSKFDFAVQNRYGVIDVPATVIRWLDLKRKVRIIGKNKRCSKRIVDFTCESLEYKMRDLIDLLVSTRSSSDPVSSVDDSAINLLRDSKEFWREIDDLEEVGDYNNL
jgi:hypothetical protein